MSQKVVVMSTGGTIAMKLDPEKGVLPAVSGKDLVEAVPGLAEVCPVEVQEFANIPSPQMTPAMMLQLAKNIEKTLQDESVLGVVVTHGTDTVEETSYLADLYINSPKPVCFTAAMRSAAEISPDGPHNILSAVRVAASPLARNLGSLVVLNETIHAAREVTKTHSANPATFASPWWGPLGYVDADRIIITRAPLGRLHLHPEDFGGEVALIKAFTGADAAFIDFCIERKVAGIVLEGFGRGNLPPPMVPGIERAVAANIPVVLTSRTYAGRVLDVYGYAGGVIVTKAIGVIPGGELSGQKARIKLMLALGLTKDRDTIASFFDEL